MEKSEFDYCFWAKLLVAIPVLPLIAFVVASYFDTPESMGIAAVIAVILVVIAVRWIDRIPALNKKIKS